MQPEITPDTSTLVALTGLAGFFVVLVFAWIIGFRHYANRMVTTTTPETGAATGAADEPVRMRIVETPIAGVVDGGPLLGGRIMRIADRDTGQRRTVRQIVTPPGPATPIVPVSIPSSPSIPDFVPDETLPADIAQQQTQMLPALPAPRKRRIAVFYNACGDRLVVRSFSPEMLPRDNWN